MSIFEDIVESYKKKFNNDLSDLNAAQISYIVLLAYEKGYAYDVDECIDYMFSYIDLVCNVLEVRSK